jgi:diadenosine tetraphosphatase ApaH/serine/threonine PP2A family protein phosphatase
LRYLIVSDIHANLEALQAVLAAAAGAYDRVVCCGDVVGYGADPNAVTDWTRASAEAVVRGNHDRASVGLDSLEWFNNSARAAALWTRRELTAENTDYIRDLPKGPLRAGGFDLVHGSPLDEDEYMLSTVDAAQVFSYLPGAVTFFGHTHVQGGFAWRKGHIEPFAGPPPGEREFVLEFDPDASYLLNPGSVGQPRDGDPRAAFVLYDPEDRFVGYRRVPYDIAAAQEKIRRAGLPAVLADRLTVGK